MSDESGIEQLRKKLYSRLGAPKARSRRKLHEESFEVSKEWTPDKDVEPTEEVKQVTRVAVERKQRSRAVIMVFSASIIFFAVSMGVAAYLFFHGSNVVSAKNIDISIGGPVAIPGGEEFALQIEVINRNPVPVILADLVVEYPEGTKSAADVNVDLARIRESLGTIAPGERVRRTERAILFGPENTDRNIKVTLEYRIADSNAIFYSDKDYGVRLSTAPLSIKVDSLKEITPGEDFDLTVHLVSNSSNVLKHILLIGDYPFGFVPKKSDPKPAFGAATWDFGDLQPKEERILKIRGTFTGENSEERVFRFEAGGQNPDNPEEIAASFQKMDVSVLLNRPFISLELTLGAPEAQNAYIASRAQRLSGDLLWANNLPFPVSDLELDLVVTGKTLDRMTVNSQDGFYRSMDNTILWSAETVPDLKQVAPGEKGRFHFAFSTIPFTLGEGVRNPSLTMVAMVKGKRLGESGVPETLQNSITKTIKLVAEPQIASKLVYTTGPFVNTGSVPPRAESETTYTAVWTVASDINDMRDVTVVSRLPSYVKWLGAVSPSDAPLSYNPSTGQLVWTLGDVPAGTGYTSPAREVAFQISFTPSLSQIKSSPILVEGQTLSGVDLYTNTVIETKHGELTTQLSNDPNIGSEGSSVVP